MQPVTFALAVASRSNLRAIGCGNAPATHPSAQSSMRSRPATSSRGGCRRVWPAVGSSRRIRLLRSRSKSTLRSKLIFLRSTNPLHKPSPTRSAVNPCNCSRLLPGLSSARFCTRLPCLLRSRRGKGRPSRPSLPSPSRFRLSRPVMSGISPAHHHQCRRQCAR